MDKRKLRFGDRKDARYLRDMDQMHVIMAHLMPNRSDNEAFLRLKVDMTNLDAFLARKNEGLDHDHRYTAFHVIVAALVRTVALRPKLNRFIQGRRFYERWDISTTFVVKKKFRDDAHESLAFLHFDREATVDSVHERLMKEIFECRKEGDSRDSTESAMGILEKLPRWLLRIVFFVLRRLDFYGKVPRGLIVSDPNYASLFLTNLGSIGLDAAYHHLNNWGTNSVFVTIGKIHDETTLLSDGTTETKRVLELGVTLDERIADGYYYAKSLQILKGLLEAPEALEAPPEEEIKA